MSSPSEITVFSVVDGDDAAQEAQCTGPVPVQLAAVYPGMVPQFLPLEKVMTGRTFHQAVATTGQAVVASAREADPQSTYKKHWSIMGRKEG